MIAPISYECAAYSLARFGDDEEMEIGAKAMGIEMTVFESVRLGLEQTLAGRVESLDGVMRWTNMMMQHGVQRPQDFDTKYAVRGVELRAQAGLGLSE